MKGPVTSAATDLHISHNGLGSGLGPSAASLRVGAGPLRVLLLVTDLEIGGTPTVVRELAMRLPQLGGVQTEVACLAEPGPVAQQIAQGGVPVFSLGAQSSLALPLVARRLCQLVPARKIDLVFSFLLHANAVATICKPFLPGVRFIQSIQTTQPGPRWHWAVQSAAQQAAECVVVPSRSAAKAAHDWANVERDRIVVIPNAVDPAQWEPNPRVRQMVADRPGDYVGFIGRLDPVKRVGDLVDAVALSAASMHLDIYGDGPERGLIAQHIADLELDSRVLMHGSVPDTRIPLATMDVLVLPSAAEGFGLVLIEAMASGVPVVASNVAGIRDVITHEQNGLLVPVGDAYALAAAIKRVLRDKPLRDRLIAAGLATVREKYAWSAVLPMYAKLLGEPSEK
jgi:glycosyltransferase involved in cell wall biosynthesis